MALTIAPAPGQYDKTDQDRFRFKVETADGENLKLGQVLDELLFRDTVTGTIVTVVVTSGALVVT